MVGLLTALHILIAIALILIVLLQSAQGTDIAGAFGGMGSQAAFGPRGTTTFLSKATIALAALFMVTSVSLSIIGSRGASGNDSVLSGEPASPLTAPATPAVPAAPGTAPAPGPEGAPAVQVDTSGSATDGMKAHVTVENPAPTAGAPAATVETGTPAPAATTPAPAANKAPASPAPAGKQ